MLNWSLKPSTLKAAAELGASVVITVYAAYEEELAEEPSEP